jgi:hypothetical protein
MSLERARQNDKRIRRRLRERKGSKHSAYWTRGCRCSYCMHGKVFFKKEKQKYLEDRSSNGTESK